MNRTDLIAALECGGDILLTHAFPLANDHKFLAKEEQKEIIRKRVAAGVI
jgi:hypothetical protein